MPKSHDLRKVLPKTSVRPHDWLSPSPRGTTHLPETLRSEIGNPEMIPWIPDANLVVAYRPDITLEEFELGLEIMIMDVKLRYSGKSDEEITKVLSELRDLLRKRDYASLANIINRSKDKPQSALDEVVVESIGEKN